MANANEKEEFFLNGWLGEKIAEHWLKEDGWEITDRNEMELRGGSSGDIDIQAKKGRKELIAEVKFWSTLNLTPSWVVQFMLGKNKLNSLFKPRSGKPVYMLFMYKRPRGYFDYASAENTKYFKKLTEKYNVSEVFLKKLDGKSYHDFAYKIIRSQIKGAFTFKIMYFKEYFDTLDFSELKRMKKNIKKDLIDEFNGIYDCHVRRAKNDGI